MFSYSKIALLSAFAALSLAGTVRAQDNTLATLILANDGTCPADTTPDNGVDADVTAVVRFIETATATVSAAGTTLLTADLSVNIDVCLCVAADADIGLIDLPVDLQADALADLEAYAAAHVATNALAEAFNTVADAPGADVTATLVPVQRTNCECPTDATPTCVDGKCSCRCPTGSFYDAAAGVCRLSPSGLTRRMRAKTAQLEMRQAKRADVAARERRA